MLLVIIFFDEDSSYKPSVELKDFLDAGKPPICISFGSMVNRDAERINNILREAIVKTNNRGIILSGWSEVDAGSNSDLLYLNAVPHDWLLPQCKMIIHHGGAGTTSAGLQAGIPNIVIPFTADQPFWGRRVYAVGAGPKPIYVNQFSVDKLMHVIVEAEGKEIRKHAQAIGQSIGGEDGVKYAASLIETCQSNFRNFKVQLPNNY